MISQNHTTSQVKEAKIDLTDFSFYASYFNKKTVTILSLFFNATKRFPLVFFSHTTVAFLTNMSVSTVRRSLDQLRRQGFITWHKRYGYNKTNEYEVERSLFSPDSERKLRYIFRLFLAISLSFVLSKPRTEGNERLLYIGNYKYKFTVVESYSTHPTHPPHFSINEKSKKVRAMQDLKDRYQIIQKISSKYPLTLRGTLKLASYPQDALRYVLSLAKYWIHKETPFRVILWSAEEYCKKYSILVQRDTYELACKSHSLPLIDRTVPYKEENYAHPRVSVLPPSFEKNKSHKPTVPTLWQPDKRLPTPQETEQTRKEVVGMLGNSEKMNCFQQMIYNSFKESAGVDGS